MHEILIKAFADGIVESLKARFEIVDEDGPVRTFAAVDLGEDHIDDDIHSVSVKFYWETHNKIVGTVDRSLQTTLHINVLNGKTDIGYQGGWENLTPMRIDSAADWITAEAAKPDFSW